MSSPTREPAQLPATKAGYAAKTFDSAEARAYREELRAWLKSVLPAYDARLSSAAGEAEGEAIQRAWDVETYRAGYSGISWPVEHGGQGLGPIEEVIFYEESALAGAPMGRGRFAQHLIGALIMEVGTEKQKARFLHDIISGAKIWCQGSSEPGAGSDLPAVSTRATRTADGYAIRGRKIWTSNAHAADWCWMLARTSETEPRYRNLSLLLVNMRQPGVRLERIRQITGESRFSEVIFEDAVAESENRLGEENQGWQVMVAGLVRERGVYQSMWRYIELSRLQKQATECMRHTRRGNREALDRFAIAVSTVKWQVQRSVEGRLAGRDVRGAEAILKLYWSELWQQLAAFCLELRCPHHSEEFRNSYFEGRASTIWGGTSEIQRNTIADHVLKLPRA